MSDALFGFTEDEDFYVAGSKKLEKLEGDIADLSSNEPDGPFFFDDDGDDFEETECAHEAAILACCAVSKTFYAM